MTVGAFPIKRAERGILFFSWGFFLVSLLAITLLVASFTFFLDRAIGWWQFPIALVFAMGLNFLFFGFPMQSRNVLLTFLNIGVPVILVVLSLLISSYFYDVSYDGQAYHQEAIIQLNEGWNPYRQYLSDDVNQAIWVNHYAKGMEIIQACIYTTFGNIEAGKATNIMLWIASICVVLAMMQEFGAIGLRTGLLISFLLGSSTVVFNQLITFYVDGTLSSCILMVVALGVSMLLGQKIPRFTHGILLVCLIVLMFNIKFTGIFYAGYFIAGLCVWLVCTGRWVELRPLIGFSVAGALVGLFIGYNPYVTNMLDFGHPLYPLMGENPADIMAINTPGWFVGKSDIERFFISLFAHTENLYQWDEHRIPLKFPFSLHKTDIVNGSRVDSRLAGFGPFFSGILLLSIIFGWLLIAAIRRATVISGILFLVGMILLSLVLVPESWWARYVPQFWFVPFILLIFAKVVLKDRFGVFRRILYLACLANFMFCLPGIFINVTLTEQIRYQLKVFKADNQPVILDWGDSESNRVRFMKNNIAYIEDKRLINLEAPPDKVVTKFPGSAARFLQSFGSSGNAVTKSSWLRLNEWWLPNTWKHY